MRIGTLLAALGTLVGVGLYLNFSSNSPKVMDSLGQLNIDDGVLFWAVI